MPLEAKQINQLANAGSGELTKDEVREVEVKVDSDYFNKKRVANEEWHADHLSGYIQTPEDRSYTLVLYAPANGILKRLTTVCAGGSFDVDVHINGVAVTGMNSSVSTTQINRDATALNTFKGGDKIEFVVTNSASSPRDFEFSLLMAIGIVLDYPA